MLTVLTTVSAAWNPLEIHLLAQKESPGKRGDEGQEGPECDLQRGGSGLQADCAGGLLEEDVVGYKEIVEHPT